jgi:hypothetical protein
MEALLITFDILNILNKKEQYPIIIAHLIRILEYDKNFPLISFAINEMR